MCNIEYHKTFYKYFVIFFGCKRKDALSQIERSVLWWTIKPLIFSNIGYQTLTAHERLVSKTILHFVNALTWHETWCTAVSDKPHSSLLILDAVRENCIGLCSGLTFDWLLNNKHINFDTKLIIRRDAAWYD